MRSFTTLFLFTSLIVSAADARADVGTDQPRVASPAAKRTAHRILGAGALTFGLAYVPMLALGVASTVDGIEHFQLLCSDTCTPNNAATLIFPIAGPFMYGTSSERDHLFGKPSPAASALLVTDGVLQVSGLVTMVAAGLYYMAASDPPPRVETSERGLSLEPSWAREERAWMPSCDFESRSGALASSQMMRSDAGEPARRIESAAFLAHFSPALRARE